MKYPIVWDGKQWRKATKEEYNNEIVNFPMYGRANYIMTSVWNLPVVDTNALTGSKTVKSGNDKSVQFRFSCARNTETAQIVRAYKLGLDRNSKAGVRFNYAKTGTVFTFETTFCGSTSALEKFLKRLEGTSSVKSLQVRLRDEGTGEVSSFKKFTYNNLTLGVIRYLRDTLDIKGYNKVKIKDLKVVPTDNIYGVIVTL